MWVKLPKMDCFNFFELNTPSNRVFYRLLENHKIVEIQQAELKLWPFKDKYLYPML